MRDRSFRLVLPLAALLAAAACSPSRNEAPPADQAGATDQTSAPAQATGSEGTITATPPADEPSVAAEPPLRTAPADGRADQAAPAARSTAPSAASSGGPAAAPRASAPPPAPATAPETATPAARRGAAEPSRDADRPATAVDAPAASASVRETPPPAQARMVSIPENTPLRLALQTAVASDTSAVEDRVTARVTDDVVVGGETVIPEGSRVEGRVTYAQPSAKVKGRAGVTIRFHTLTVGSRSYDIVSEPFRREAPATTSKDVRNIGIGAGAGAVIGGILGGRKGAGIGAAVGGAGGTGVALATKGAEVRLPVGTAVTTRLSDPLVLELRGGSR